MENEGNVLVCVVYVCLYTWKKKKLRVAGGMKISCLNLSAFCFILWRNIELPTLIKRFEKNIFYWLYLN